MSPLLASIYVRSRHRIEQRLRKSNPPQEGGLAEASWLVPFASASFRTTPFLSERHKFDSPSAGEPLARDVVRRRWTRATHDMHDLRGQTGVALAEEHRRTFLGELMNRRVRTASHVHARPIDRFGGGRTKNARRGGVLSTLVRASTPILYCCDSRQESESEHNVFNKERIRNQGGRLDAPCRESPTVQRFSPVHPRNRRLDGMDERSGEVTL